MLNISPIIWWLANMLSFGIYGLQWYWLAKIAKILLKH